jgi:hypothetical protein
LLAAAGCNQVLGVTDPHLHGGGGAGDDGGMIGSGGGFPCTGDDFGYTISNVASCDIPFAATDLPFLDVATTATIDTTAGMLTVGPATIPLPSTALVTQHDGGQARVIALTGLDVPSGITIQVVGQYGLVLVVDGDVSIDGVLLASADHTTPAAGSRSAAACSASAGAAGTVGAIGATNSSGAGGGGYGASGATGGATMAFLGSSIIPGGAGGIADPNLTLRPLRGGCPGGGGVGGVPASGGGAIQISASGRIDISGTIAAGGGGAIASDTSSAAAAGGSGGGILLEASAIAMTAKAAVTANGGAGADGSGTAATCSGENGHPSNAIPAAGGSCSGDITGGAGGTSTAPAHGGDSGMRGTGGGGAVGRIGIHSHVFTLGTGIVSPPPSVETF